MKDNSIWRAVREGRPALGTGLKEFASRGVPWIIEASGFDYCMIDHEHGAFDLETIADLAGWFQATNVSAIVRIHKSFTYLIPAILDQGIMGVQVSEVDNVEEARAIGTGGQISADRQSRHLGTGDAHRIPQLWRSSRDRICAMGQCQHHRLRLDRVARGAGERRGDRGRRRDRHDRLWPLGPECAPGRSSPA